MALTQPRTVISAFVADLTGSTFWMSGLSTVLTVAEVFTQFFVSRWIEPRPHQLPYLLFAISLRIVSWCFLAWLIYAIGNQQPITLAWILVSMLITFFAGGGIANIPFPDIIGKVIPEGKRRAFIDGKGALAGSISVGAALVAQQICRNVLWGRCNHNSPLSS